MSVAVAVAVVAQDPWTLRSTWTVDCPAVAVEVEVEVVAVLRVSWEEGSQEVVSEVVLEAGREAERRLAARFDCRADVRSLEAEAGAASPPRARTLRILGRVRPARLASNAGRRPTARISPHPQRTGPESLGLLSSPHRDR